MVKEIKTYLEHSRRPWFSLSSSLSSIYHVNRCEQSVPFTIYCWAKTSRWFFSSQMFKFQVECCDLHFWRGWNTIGRTCNTWAGAMHGRSMHHLTVHLIHYNSSKFGHNWWHRGSLCLIHSFFIKECCFLAQPECSYFSVHFRNYS